MTKSRALDRAASRAASAFCNFVMLPRRSTDSTTPAIARTTRTVFLLIVALQAFVTYRWDPWHQTDVTHEDSETLPLGPSDSCPGLCYSAHTTLAL